MKKAVVYVHGKGGNASEAEHYKPLFPGHEVIGFDYRSQTPWEAAEKFPAFFGQVISEYGGVVLIANSIGAYLSMTSLAGLRIDRAFLISPVIDMERLILGMMAWEGVTEAELEQRREIPSQSGETLSWEYLRYVREHPVSWQVPTEILYGERDELTSFETVTAFAESIKAGLTVMPGGEHWFHTEEQMAFLDEWIKRNKK